MRAFGHELDDRRDQRVAEIARAIVGSTVWST